MAGLRGRGAPGRSFNNLIEVCSSTDETEMRICAGRVAGYAGLVIEEQGNEEPASVRQLAVLDPVGLVASAPSRRRRSAS